MRLLLILLCAVGFTRIVSAQTLTPDYVAHADSADWYLKHEQWSDAERTIVSALRHDPANKSNYLLWSNLGIARTQMEDYDGAIEACSIGLASAPHSTVLLSNRARAYLAKGEIKAAMADLDTALRQDSTLQWPLRMRGVLRAMQHDTPGALADLNAYTQRYGEDAAVEESLGDLAAGAGDCSAAIKAYRKSYELDPDISLLTKALLTAYAFGRIEEMEEDIRKGISDYPKEGVLYLIRGMLNKRKYQTEAMERDLRTALELGVDRRLYNQLTATERLRQP